MKILISKNKTEISDIPLQASQCRGKLTLIVTEGNTKEQYITIRVECSNTTSF